MIIRQINKKAYSKCFAPVVWTKQEIIDSSILIVVLFVFMLGVFLFCFLFFYTNKLRGVNIKLID